MNKQVIQLNLLYFLRFFGDSMFFPFLVLFFNASSIQGMQLGILMGVIPLFQVLGNLFWGRISGGLKKTLVILRVMIFLELLSMIVFGFVTDFYWLLALTIIIAFINNPFFNLQDGIAIKISEEAKNKYAKTRMCGSFAYLIGVISGGYLADRFGFRFVFIVGAVSYILCLILLCFLARHPHENHDEKKESISFSAVFKTKGFFLYAVFFLLMLGSYNVGESYMSAYLKSLGLQVDQWGMVYGLMMIFEIVTMIIVAKKFKESSFRGLLILGVGLLTLRLGLSALPLPLYVLVAIAPLRGIGWGLFLATNLNIIKKMLGTSLAVKAVSILGTAQGLMIGIMNYLAPLIYETFSYNILYLILFISACTGIVVLLFIKMDFLKSSSSNQ